MGSAAPAAVVQSAARAFSRTIASSEDRPVDVRDAVLNALSGAGQRILINMLETAEWQVEGNELVIKVASSATVHRDVVGRGCQAADDCHRQRSLGTCGEAAGGSGRSGSDCSAARVNAMAAAVDGPNKIRWSSV